jgi:hypothetical protein
VTKVGSDLGRQGRQGRLLWRCNTVPAASSSPLVTRLDMQDNSASSLANSMSCDGLPRFGGVASTTKIATNHPWVLPECRVQLVEAVHLRELSQSVQ